MGRLIAGHPIIGWAPACAGVTISDPDVCNSTPKDNYPCPLAINYAIGYINHDKIMSRNQKSFDLQGLLSPRALFCRIVAVQPQVTGRIAAIRLPLLRD